MHRYLSVAAVCALAACSSDGPSGPSGPTTHISLDACGDIGAVFGADWIAIRNEGMGWQQLTPTFGGNLEFEATERFSLAMAASFFGAQFTQVLNVTVAEIEGDASQSLCDLFGNRVIRGSVAGVSGEQWVDIFGAGSIDYASADDLEYELTDLPASTVDVIALRYATAFTQPPDRVIVRRGLIPNADGLPISTMDFTTEGSAPASNTVTVTNGGSDLLSVSSAVTSGNGTYVPLGTLGTLGASAFNYVSLPAEQRFSSDLHELTLYASAATTDRTVIRYYSTPSDLSLALGADVSVPTLTTVASSPYQRVRATLPAQAEYGAAAMAEFYQEVDESSFRVISVTTTRGFVGGTTPASWELEIPDFSGSGYQASWGLAAGAYDWSVTAVSGDPVFGNAPAPGVTLQFASRYSSTVGAAHAPARRVRGKGTPERDPACLLKVACHRR